MSYITIPEIKAPSTTMRLIRGDSTLEFFDGSVVGIQSTKALWVLSFPLVVQRLPEARLWQAAFVQLAKSINVFEVTPPGWYNGVNWVGNNPTVQGSGQLGLYIEAYMAGVLNTTIALAGDYVQIGSELKMLTEDAVTNSSGFVGFSIEPAMREPTIHGDVIDIKTPKCTMRFLTQEVSWNNSLPDYYNMTVDAIEHWGPPEPEEPEEPE